MFMFDSKNGDVEKITGNIASNIKMADISLLNFTKSLKNSLTDIQGVINSVAGYNTIAANTARETMGSTRIVGNAIQKASAAAAENTLLVGKGVEDNIKLYGALNESMMRLTFFSDKQIEAFQILGFTANMSAAELATMATSFDTLGYMLFVSNNDSLYFIVSINFVASLRGANRLRLYPLNLIWIMPAKGR